MNIIVSAGPVSEKGMIKLTEKKIFVTGAAGFIGSHLCERLVKEGVSVTGVDNFDDFYARDIKEANISNALQKKNFKFIEGDIRDRQLVEDVLWQGNTNMIVHLAAKAGVRPSIEDPASYVDVNIGGTQVLLEAAKKSGIKNFIFASSSSVYGNNCKVPFCETDNIDFPISPYAATKKACELLCHTYSHLYGINMTCLRFFTVYGPRQRPDLAIHKFAKLIEAGEPIPVFGDGSMKRDFTYITDIIDGVMAAIRKCQGYEIYNLGESRPVRLDRLVEEIEKALGKKAIINHLPMRPGDVMQTYADVSKATGELGYEPKVELRAGLSEFVKWLRDEGNRTN